MLTEGSPDIVILKKKPTIEDVARKARVSIATVSFVLNNRPGQVISEPVKKRVWKAVEQLQYHPSASAAALARQRTHNVAIVFYRSPHLISNQFYSFVIQGAVKEASVRGYNLLFSYIDRDYGGYADLPAVIRERNTEGVLFIQHLSPQMVADIRLRGVPVVAVDNYPPTTDVTSLLIDNNHGGAVAAEHLLSLGHERIAMLVGAADRPSIAERSEGFIATAAERGVVLSRRNDLVQCPELSFEGARVGAKRVLRRKKRPTALFCANDEMAAGTLCAARELGLRVPDDLSVVGFDGITMSNYLDPPLTTVDVDKERLGTRAMARLVEMVENSETPPLEERVPTEILVRKSTAKPPSNAQAL